MQGQSSQLQQHKHHRRAHRGTGAVLRAEPGQKPSQHLSEAQPSSATSPSHASMARGQSSGWETNLQSGSGPAAGQLCGDEAGARPSHQPAGQNLEQHGPWQSTSTTQLKQAVGTELGLNVLVSPGSCGARWGHSGHQAPQGSTPASSSAWGCRCSCDRAQSRAQGTLPLSREKITGEPNPCP